MKKDFFYIALVVCLSYLFIHSLFMWQTYHYLWEREEEYQTEILYIANHFAKGTKIDSIALKQLENRYTITYPEIYGGYWSTNKTASYALKPKKASKMDGSKILYIVVNKDGFVEEIECSKP